MKIALVQLNYVIGDFEGNTRKIIEQIRLAAREGAGLAVFAELAVTGYPGRDYLEFDDFISRSEECMQQIAAECRGIAAIVGGPSRNLTGKGKPLFNSAWVLADGQVKQLVHKSLLPNYDVFDEYRYFEPATGSGVVEVNGTRLAVTICEDIWNTGDIPLYRRFPLDDAIAMNPELIINIAASPFHYNQSLARRQVLRDNALKYNLPVIYVNHTGAQTELIFDGGSMACDCGGNIRETLPFFSEGVQIIETGDSWYNVTAAPEVSVDDEVRDIALIHDALVLGIRDYFGKMGFSKAILGLSGGIDSAVTLALAAGALGPQNVHGILLPSEFSSDHSVEDAKTLAVNLGCPYEVIPISDAFHALENTMQPFFRDLPFGLTEENMQARIRAVILMAMANKFGYILLNTSNKSEAAVGYGTLYGDMCGGLSVLGDVYKSDVYRLAHYINRTSEIIPLNSIVKPPSAELRPGQKDSDSLPEYDVLDQLLFQYIEKRRGKRELEEMGFAPPLVARVLKMVNSNEWKRYQTPPILRVSPKAFGMGRRMPIVGKYTG